MISKIINSFFTTRGTAQATRVKSDPGAGANKLSDIYSAPGDDSRPLPDDWVYLGETETQGGTAAVGFLDPENPQKSAAGEKRIYARDDSGSEVVELHLKNNGSATLSNENGFTRLSPDGSGVISSPQGDFEVKADGTIIGTNVIGGSFELNGSNGNFIVNGVIIDLLGNITTAGVITGSALSTAGALTADTAAIGGKDFGTHTHAQSNDSDGNTEEETDPPS